MYFNEFRSVFSFHLMFCSFSFSSFFIHSSDCPSISSSVPFTITGCLKWGHAIAYMWWYEDHFLFFLSFVSRFLFSAWKSHLETSGFRQKICSRRHVRVRATTILRCQMRLFCWHFSSMLEWRGKSSDERDRNDCFSVLSIEERAMGKKFRLERSSPIRSN